MPEVYNVLGELDVLVRVRPGNGQLGGAAVALSGGSVAASAGAPRPLVACEGVPARGVVSDGSSELNLGPGAALAGAMLQVDTVLIRANPATTRGSYTIELFQRIPIGADGKPVIPIAAPHIAFNRREFGPRDVDLSEAKERRDITTIALR
ncbi:MAG TPA: hypothetical protein VMG12_42775 [Polyangiaceae bacterium]|nr:hypothetical protein [Polyangiaceae bacterium]